MPNKLTVCIAAALGIVSMPIFAEPEVNHNVSIEPVVGTATVDGDVSEWNLNTDFAANMCTAGSIGTDGNCEGNGKVNLSDLYARYNCDTDTIYMLVLENSPYTAEESNSDAWVTVGGNSNKVVKGGESGFAWVRDNEGRAIGYEASFSLAAGITENVQVHLNVSGNTSSTGKNGDTMSIIVAEECGDGEELTSCDYVYGVHDRGLNDSIIFKYHPSTGFKKLGETHVGADIEGLDISPDGVMYGSAGDDTNAPGAIYTIDMNTGAKTMVGEPSGYEIDGISFNPITGALIGWAQDEGLLDINPVTGNVVVGSASSGEIEDLSWSNDGNSVYFIENDHGGNDPDAGTDNGVPHKLKVYTNDEFVSVCGIQGKEIEALEVLQDDTLLVGYHDNGVQMVKIINPDSCEVTLDAGIDGTLYNDIEGLAVCPPIPE